MLCFSFPLLYYDMTDNRFSYSFMINRRNIMIIKNGIVADPASGLYEHMDILVKDGKIEKIAPDISCASDVTQMKRRNNRCDRNDHGTWTYRHTCTFP